MDEEDEHSPSEFYYLETFDVDTETGKLKLRADLHGTIFVGRIRQAYGSPTT